MLVEVLGFSCGAVVVGSAFLMYFRQEHCKAIRAVYGAGARKAQRRGNALIWPSR